MDGHKQKKTLLVLGATGRVARLLRAHLSLNPSENVDYIWAARRKAAGVDLVLDAGADVDSLPQCSAVLALWGAVSGGEEALSGNISLALAAQGIATACGADRVFHASSAAVYAQSRAPVNEAAECRPRNAYGAAKLRMEEVVRDAEPKSVCLRIGNVSGADGLFSAMTERDAITLDRFPDGQGPARSYLQPETLARSVETLTFAAVDELPDVINLGGKSPVAMEDLVRAAGRALLWQDAPPDALPVMALDAGRLDSLMPLGASSTNAEKIIEEWLRIRQLA